MKQALCSLCALVVLTLVFGASNSALAQTPSATPDPFAIQLTSSPAGFRSGSSDISANGRFVVFESNGDVATEKTSTRNNADGNREIFIADYAQRRIFQLTNTKNVPKPSPTPSPTPTPSPSASPTPSPVPTPADPTTIQIEISNNRPMISLAPPLNGSIRRAYYIVFSSNAPNPANFNGVDTGGALAADGNQELWIYQLPEVTDVDLTSGIDFFQNLQFDANFTQLTNTPASRVPSPGGTGVFPFVADDNREATINDDGSIIAFISTRNLVPAVGNADANPELFFYNRNTSTFIQATNTHSSSVGPVLFDVFQQNPSLSSDGAVVAFYSNANLAGSNNDDGAGHGNGEIYRATFNGTTMSNVTQVTRTKADSTQFAAVNLLSPGRRLSRNGAFIAFESLASDPKGNSTTNESFLAMFVYTVANDTFNLVGARALASPGDIIHFPTFTDYDGTLNPATLVFASALNFKTDGTFPPSDQDATGLNPNRIAQIFATQIPIASGNTFARLTKNPVGASFGGIRPLASEARKRIAFSLGGAELGGGNTDNSTEVFYLLTPPVVSESTATLSFFTGASNFPVPTVAPSPSPTPTPSASPGIEAAGVAPGELVIVRNSAEDFAPSDATATGTSEISRRPPLPVELNGVSVSVNGAAAGLYFVGNSPRQINFVVPIGLAPGVGTVVINNNGRVFRGFINIVPAQPDIFTSTNDAGGRALAFNITNPMARMPEPFQVKSLNANGDLVATVLELTLTGVRNVTPSEVTVTIGTTAISGSAILFVGPNQSMPGFDLLTFRLPESLAGAGDVPIVVTVNKSGTFTSRAVATAPHITINP